MTRDFLSATLPNATSSLPSPVVTRNANLKPLAEPSAVELSAIDRRKSAGRPAGGERRQFGSSHSGLSPAATELAVAIDQYKLVHRRRYITCEEMLIVITQLGYRKE
jgi:hypothetical protein